MEIRGSFQSSQPTNEVGKVNIEQAPKVVNETSDINLNQKDAVIVKQSDEFTKKQLDKAVDKLNKFLEDNTTHAEYAVHDKFNDVMIKIVDDKTGKTIQEIPSKKILDMVAKMCELVGMVFDKKA